MDLALNLTFGKIPQIFAMRGLMKKTVFAVVILPQQQKTAGKMKVSIYF